MRLIENLPNQKKLKTDKPASVLVEHQGSANRQRSRILTGDALALLKTLPAASFDGCFCDPPYGLSFMGKAWDHGVPGSEVWAEVLRVLKPGAPLLAFGGTRTFHRLASAIEDAGFLLSDTLCWLHGQGFPKGHAQLKPAWEPVTLAWKKGTRVLNIDAGRIPTNESPGGSGGRTKQVSGDYRTAKAAGMYAPGGNGGNVTPPLGRWPANVILDEEAAAALDQQSGTLKSGARIDVGNRTRQSAFIHTGGNCIASSGGASRFFYCAKASRKERGEGNTHPTVKPVKLCEYLAKLILPANPQAHLLIPFSGSGSEMIGARRAGWKRITGIEVNPEYVAIAEKRMECQSSSACSPEKSHAAA